MYKYVIYIAKIEHIMIMTNKSGDCKKFAMTYQTRTIIFNCHMQPIIIKKQKYYLFTSQRLHCQNDIITYYLTLFCFNLTIFVSNNSKSYMFFMLKIT